MKVLVVNNMSPFIWGGAEALAANLLKSLAAAGHEADILRIPFQWEPAERIPSQMLMTRAFELYNVEHVIALKFPAYLIRHPRKTIWLLHQYRQAYDLFDAGQTNVPRGPVGDDVRELIKRADDESFREARHVYTISETVSSRLRSYNDISASPLLPPLNDPELFMGGESGDYILAGGRINEAKRQHLLIEALAKSSTDVKAVIAGPPDAPHDGQRLSELVDRYGLRDRVKLDLRFLPREEYARYVNQSLAVACLPFDEDYGYVAVEAAAAGKPIIATSDSGGILSFAKHEQTGWVAEPVPTSLAEVIDSAWNNRSRTREFGQAARRLWKNLNLNWPATVEALLR